MYKNIVIIGASGTIGAAFVKYFAINNASAQVFAFSQSEVVNKHDGVAYHHMQYDDEKSISESASKLPAGNIIDLVIVATGVLHDGNVKPEKSMRELNYINMQHVFAANTFFPALVAKHFLPKLLINDRAIFACLSARVGSISDDHLGGWFTYRASKAALNMFIKNIAIEFCRFHKNAIVVGLHPGTVISGLSKPYSTKIAPDKLFTADKSVAFLVDVMASLSPDNSGNCYAWDGKEVPF
jgi:NAD(P)-dependent dehydrogenase (short-subunit alcohol dehydrogenase family)